MKLHKLHVDEFRAGVVSQGHPVSGVFPRVAGDSIRSADAAGRDHHRVRFENFEPAAFAIVSKRTGDAVTIFKERYNCMLHIDFDALMDPVILQGTNHFQSSAISNVGKTRIPMTTEISLKNAAILRPIKNCTPCFQLSNSGRRFQSVQLSHPPVVDVLATAHGVREMDLPIVTIVHIGKRRSNSALSHYGVRLS
jgi:hypothetical protein